MWLFCILSGFVRLWGTGPAASSEGQYLIFQTDSLGIGVKVALFRYVSFGFRSGSDFFINAVLAQPVFVVILAAGVFIRLRPELFEFAQDIVVEEVRGPPAGFTEAGIARIGMLL